MYCKHPFYGLLCNFWPNPRGLPTYYPSICCTCRISTGRGLSWHPLRRRDGRTHFGSINSLSHASSVFSRMTHLKADDKARAKAGLDFDGMKRRVGWLRRHTSSKVGRPGSGWLRSASAGLGGNGPAKSGTEEATPPPLHFLEWEDCLLLETSWRQIRQT